MSLGALSADHLEWIDADDVAAMAEADVAAVLLPIVTTFLDLEHRAPARALADAGVRVAVSTDYNPGSAHSTNLALAASLSCTLHKLTPAEALAGVTRVAAEVCGLAGRFGVVKPGAFGGLLASDLKDWRALPYFVDAPPIRWAWRPPTSGPKAVPDEGDLCVGPCGAAPQQRPRRPTDERRGAEREQDVREGRVALTFVAEAQRALGVELE